MDLRVAAARQPQEISRALADSEKVHDDLWSHAIALARADLNSDIGALFVESLNEGIDLNTSRVTVALQYRIPKSIWLALLVVTVLTMAAVGYQFGLAGRSNFLIELLMALTFSAVVLLIALIADLDRATQGMIRVSQQPMLELQRKLSSE